MALIFGSSDPQRSSEISRDVRNGRLRKLASKIYTDDLASSPEDVVRRHYLEIAAHFYPGAVISHRSGLTNGHVTPRRKLHLTLAQTVAPVRELPGLEIRLWQGPAAQPDDIPTTFGAEQNQRLHTSTQARALLENLQIARARGDDEPKILPSEDLELWLDRRIRIHGPAWLDQTLSQAIPLAERFEWHREIEELRQLFAAFQGTPSRRRLESDVARARSQGLPYDPERMELFRILHLRLAREQFVHLPAPAALEAEPRAFWEAYFSNFIEGTRFTVEEAQVLVYDAVAARNLEDSRPEDAHDVRETYRLIVDPRISREVPRDPAHFLELTRRRHARMMASRLAIEPGVFKTKSNSVGSRVFVAPELVTETLTRAWSLGSNLPAGPARALFLMFILAEVHPFNDGNGRISRLALNAEMDAAGHARLIVPTSLRTDYLSVLEALTANRDPEPFIAFAHRIITFNSRMVFANFDAAHNFFRTSGALDETSNHFDLSSLMRTSS